MVLTDLLATSIQAPDSAPSVGSMLAWNPQPFPVLPVLAIAAALAYLAGLARLRRLQRTWPWWRTACFLGGCLLLAATTGLGIEGYGYQLFSVWMFQHLTLSMTIPPLLVWGCPGLMLLRATPHRGLGRLVLAVAVSGLRSRTARWVLHPGFTIPLFLFSYYGIYLTPVFDTMASTILGHQLLEMFFLLSGLLFVVPILSVGPLPIRQTNLGRFFDLFVEMPLHVFFGVILMMATTPLVEFFAAPPPQWGIDALRDQYLAGALAWSYGEPVALVVVIVFAIRWRRDEVRENALADQRADLVGDDELAAYNAFLKNLHPSRPTGSRPSLLADQPARHTHDASTDSTITMAAPAPLVVRQHEGTPDE
ncbi:cytochrome c oxidase assembly protein [Nocardia sp. NPDC004415]